MSLDDWYFPYLRMKCRVLKDWARFRGRDPNPDMARFVAQYRRIWREAAQAISADFTEISEGCWEVGSRGRTTLIHNYRVQIDDPVVMALAGDKAVCYRLMRAEGLSVPDHVSFRVGEFSKARAFLGERTGAFFVVKPSSGTAGARGVTTHVGTYREMLYAVALASQFGDGILLERLIPGESYRFLVLDGTVVHVARRRGVRVSGDGSSSIGELARKSAAAVATATGTDARHFLGRDRDVRATLDAQRYALDSIPRKGEEVLVRSNPGHPGRYRENCTYYDEAVTDMICPDLMDQAARAARAVRSRFAGVDLITVNPAVPLAQSGGGINEVNTTPGLHNHYDLLRNGGIPAAARVLDYLLDPGVGSIGNDNGIGEVDVSRGGG